jgi:hypothetical protein
MLPGIADRMQKELTSLSPASTKVCWLYLSIPIHGPWCIFFFPFFRSRLSRLPSECTLYGWVDLFWLLSAPSKISGAPSKSMTNLALVSFTAVSHFYLSFYFLTFLLFWCVVIVECFNTSGPAVSASSYTEARTEHSKRKAEELQGDISESSFIQVWLFYWNFLMS